MTPREPGIVATQHIFANPGEYEATLTFKKKGDATTHSVVFNFRIRDRRNSKSRRPRHLAWNTSVAQCTSQLASAPLGAGTT